MQIASWNEIAIYAFANVTNRDQRNNADNEVRYNVIVLEIKCGNEEWNASVRVRGRSKNAVEICNRKT